MKSKEGYSRRRFLHTAGAGTASVVLGSQLLAACGTKEKAAAEVADVAEAAPEAIHKISCQLYTFRKEMGKDLPGTIEKVAGTGLKTVETFEFPPELREMAGYEADVKAVAKMLNDNGLSVSSMHGAIPTEEQKASILEMAEAYDCNKLIWHGWPEDNRYQSEDGIKELADIYNEANQFLKSNGMEFGLHNHWWEMRLNENGRYPLQTLVEYMDDDIFFEIDTYWVKTAQQDPAEIVDKYGKRVKFMHIKDGNAPWKEDLAAQPHEPMVALGNGVMDFESITEACGEDPKWYVIELDECATDIFVAVKESIDYLVSNNMAKV